MAIAQVLAPAILVTRAEVTPETSSYWHERCAEVGASFEAQIVGSFGIPDAKDERRVSMDWAKLLVVESGDLLRAGRVRSPERLLELLGKLSEGGLDLVVLEGPAFDTRRSYTLREALSLAVEIRSKGRGAGVKEWRARAAQEGVRTGRFTKCSNCHHGVNRLTNPGRGHTRRRDGRPGPCTAPACGCPAWVP